MHDNNSNFSKRLTAEAEQARQELKEHVEDRERRLEIEVQNVKVSLYILSLVHGIKSNPSKRLELQLRCLENDRPVTNLDPVMDDGNVDRMDVDRGHSGTALGKRPERPEADAHTRDISPSQMDLDNGPSEEALGKGARREVVLNFLFNALN